MGTARAGPRYDGDDQKFTVALRAVAVGWMQVNGQVRSVFLASRVQLVGR
jgi:hypothetical protein